MSKNYCLGCDCNDPGMGCTMPSIDKWYACPIEAENVTELDFMTTSELIEIISRQDRLLDFMNRYNLMGLREATVEQLKEYIEEEFNHGTK